MAQAAERMAVIRVAGAEKTSGALFVAGALGNEGADTVFTLCGDHIINNFDGCLDEHIRIVDIRVRPNASAPGTKNRTMYM